MNHFAEICKSQHLFTNHATEVTALPGKLLPTVFPCALSVLSSQSPEVASVFACWVWNAGFISFVTPKAWEVWKQITVRELVIQLNKLDCLQVHAAAAGLAATTLTLWKPGEDPEMCLLCGICANALKEKSSCLQQPRCSWVEPVFTSCSFMLAEKLWVVWLSGMPHFSPVPTHLACASLPSFWVNQLVYLEILWHNVFISQASIPP